MAWKPKEKKLSAEEAIALAKKELAPYWFGSPPLLAGISSGGRSTAHPLDPKFSEKTWLVLFIDATTFSGQAALEIFREWYRRYGSHDLHFLLFLRFPYQRIYTRAAVEETLVQALELSFPVAVDIDGTLGAAFGALRMPKVLCLQGGRMLFEYSGADCADRGELRIQELLRKSDPGLPLLPPIIGNKGIGDLTQIELGLTSKSQIEVAGSPPEIPPPDRVVITGTWKREPEFLQTNDPTATISFRSPGRRLSLIARSEQKTIETGIIQLQINGISAFEAFHGKQLATDEEGNTIIRISSAWLYDALVDLPETDRNITLRFPTANSLPVSVYGVRFGN